MDPAMLVAPADVRPRAPVERVTVQAIDQSTRGPVLLFVVAGIG